MLLRRSLLSLQLQELLHLHPPCETQVGGISHPVPRVPVPLPGAPPGLAHTPPQHLQDSAGRVIRSTETLRPPAPQAPLPTPGPGQMPAVHSFTHFYLYSGTLHGLYSWWTSQDRNASQRHRGILWLMSWAPKGWLLEPDLRAMQGEGA